MGQVGLIVLSIAVATLVLVGASLGAEWLQPQMWLAEEHVWLVPVLLGPLPGLYAILHWWRRKRV